MGQLVFITKFQFSRFLIFSNKNYKIFFSKTHFLAILNTNLLLFKMKNLYMQYFLNYSFSIQQYYGKVVENFITKNFPIVLLYQLSLVSEIFVQYVCIYTNLQNLYMEVVDNYISRNFPIALLFQFSIFQILNDIVGTAVSKEKVDRTVKQHLRSSM